MSNRKRKLKKKLWLHLTKAYDHMIKCNVSKLRHYEVVADMLEMRLSKLDPNSPCLKWARPSTEYLLGRSNFGRNEDTPRHGMEMLHEDPIRWTGR